MTNTRFRDSVKHLLLVGGGHSHLAVLKSFGDAPAEGVHLALLSPSRHAFYSGMVPGVVAGHYRPEDCRVDLGALAARAGARFLLDSAAGVDPARREVTTARGERLHYDVLSLDTGSSAGEPAGGERFEAQAAVWATGAYAPPWVAQSGLATDARGFVAVSDTLQSHSCPEIFAAGDVATVVGEARPKSGVFAVRQGPVLARNLRRALAGEASERFRPPSRSLALISCGDRYAVASWGGFALEGAWVWRWKDRIDRRFVERYRPGPAGG